MKKTVRHNAIKGLVVSLPIACALALPQSAYADESQNCPPGSWFCGNTQPAPTGGPANGNGLPALPAPDEKAMMPRTVADTTPPPPPPPPPSGFYQRQQPTVVVVRQAPPPPPPYAYGPPPPRYVVRRPPPTEWGLNVHAGGLFLPNGSGRNRDAGMGLVGVGLRFRPVPVFALEADLDFAGGRDYYDFRRFETALSINGIFFLNPRDMTQVYLVGGFGWSTANITDDQSSAYYDYKYTFDYFGAQGGIGLEFRLSPTIALNVDVRGIVRTRIDDDRDRYPEFVDSNGRTTNTSGAGLVQGGLTFYW